MIGDQMLCIVTPDGAAAAARLPALWPRLRDLFAGVGKLHFAALALLPPSAAPGDPRPRLLLELAVDDDLRPAQTIDLLIARDAGALLQLYGLADAASLRAHLRAHTDRAAGGFVGCRDRAVRQILREKALFDAARGHCSTLPAVTPQHATGTVSALAAWAAAQARFAGLDLPPPRSLWRADRGGRRLLNGLALAALVMLAAGLLLPWSGRGLLWAALPIVALVPLLRRRLDRPGRHEVPRALQVHPSVEACEAALAARVSHMISLTDVRRPLWFWRPLLRLTLGAIGWLGHLAFTEGRLGMAAGIHFGHWHLVDGGRRLLFCSNFDGGFGDYLDEFIRGAAPGVNRVWGCTELRARPAAAPGQPEVVRPRAFPPLRFAFLGGCTHELWFKSYARDSLLPHLARFEAYALSTEDINRATRLRASLWGPRSAQADDQVLRALES